MANLYEAVSRTIRPYYYFILIGVICIVFAVASWFIYKRYKAKENDLEKNADIYAGTAPPTMILYLFYADWCPACKRAKPEWNSFRDQYDKRVINGYKLSCVEIECSDESGETADLVSRYNITQFPTIKLVKGSDVYDFEAKVTTNHLEKFVHSV